MVNKKFKGEVYENVRVLDSTIDTPKPGFCVEKAQLAIPEVIEGIDDPETANYFKNEVKAPQIVVRFLEKRVNRETLNRDDIQELGKYIGNILNIKENINIVLGDTGPCSYNHSKKELYIHKQFLSDPDMILFEVACAYRHAYQHKRAQLARSGISRVIRDYQFLDNFENYIDMMDDFEKHCEQIVEKDAGDFAINILEYFDIKFLPEVLFNKN